MSLSEFRKSNKLTQVEMADRIGVSYSLYTKIEIGIRNPSYNFIVLLRKTFPELNIEEMFFSSK